MSSAWSPACIRSHERTVALRHRPPLNEAALIGQTLSRIHVVLPDAPVIVSDGGSTDDTVGIAVRAGAEVIAAPRGRGSQCRAGAMQATSDWLLFLHADTLLPLEAGVVFRELGSKPAVQIGTFRVRFADGSKFLNALAWAASRGDVCSRASATKAFSFGVRFTRSWWPLFENVALLQKARKGSRVHWLSACVTTSARRFNAQGLLRQRLLNAELMLRYLAGASPFEPAAHYRVHSAQPPPDLARRRKMVTPINGDGAELTKLGTPA
jgi:hypothetical protein